MWRTQSVVSMLLEEVAGLTSADHEVLENARKRCRWTILLDTVAILLLVALHDRGLPQLTLSGNVQTVFTLGILAVAAHAGFKLGTLDKLNAVARAVEELASRTDDS